MKKQQTIRPDISLEFDADSLLGFQNNISEIKGVNKTFENSQIEQMVCQIQNSPSRQSQIKSRPKKVQISSKPQQKGFFKKKQADNSERVDIFDSRILF
jgi:hypothetical protein